MSHVKESCQIRMRYVTHEWVVSHMKESCHTRMSHVTCDRVMSQMNEACHVWKSHVTHEISHTWVSHVTHKWVMESILYKASHSNPLIQVLIYVCSEYCLFGRALLQKRPMFSRSLLMDIFIHILEPGLRVTWLI